MSSWHLVLLMVPECLHSFSAVEGTVHWNTLPVFPAQQDCADTESTANEIQDSGLNSMWWK